MPHGRQEAVAMYRQPLGYATATQELGGVSAARLHGCGRFNLQSTSRGGVRRRGSPDHVGRLAEEGWGHGEAEGMGGLEVDHQLQAGAAFFAPLLLDGREK
jgi:hypothetical protein